MSRPSLKRGLVGLLGGCFALGILVGGASTAGAQQRGDPMSGVWDTYWKLKGSTERYLDTQAAYLNSQIEIQKGRTIENKTVIEKQEISIGVQNSYGSTGIINSQSTNVSDSQNVKIIGQQDAANANVTPTINAAGGNASSTTASSNTSQNNSNPNNLPLDNGKKNPKDGQYGFNR